MRQYVDEAIASPYSRNNITVGIRESFPINCSRPTEAVYVIWIAKSEFKKKVI